MDPNSPFAKQVPIIGEPKILNVVAVALIQCNCEAKALLMGPVGPAPFVCGACKKAWELQAQVGVAIFPVINPMSAESKLIQ